MYNNHVIILLQGNIVRINSIASTLQTNGNNTNIKKHGIAFGTYNPEAARKIEAELAQKGISCNVKGNNFVAECYKKTVEVFEKLFKRSYLPDVLSFEPLSDEVCGAYGNIRNQVILNEEKDFDYFYDMDDLKKYMESKRHILRPSWFSTKHPAHVFVHEFSHAAHWHHLVQRNGLENAKKVWYGLNEVLVPTSIGRLITRFKLSNYAVDGEDMCEFLAERMTKDICGGLTDNMWLQYKDIDVDYSNIFSKKWNYRYSSPQSYIDYFTQQVWNGDIEEANRTGEMIESYLAELDADKVSPVVQKIANKLGNTHTTTESKSILAKIGLWLSQAIVNLNENMTSNLDDRNRLRLNH